MVELKPKIPPTPKQSAPNPLIEEERVFMKDALAKMWKHKMKPGWVYYQFKDKYGKSPSRHLFFQVLFGEHPTEGDKERYWQFLTSKAPDDERYCQQYFLYEFGHTRIKPAEEIAEYFEVEAIPF